MQEGDALAFRADPRPLVDEAQPRGAAPFEGAVQVVHREADVVDAGTALREELRDGRLLVGRFEELDERLAGRQPGDAGSVRVVERDGGQAEDVAVERQDLVEGTDGEPDVGDPRASRWGIWHGVGARTTSVWWTGAQ